MEAARKTVEVLTQRILPERPHHLSFHTDWRYRTSSGDPKRFEEWHNTRLQYLTLLSEADRGVLLTRSDYDMREEPVKPLPREVNALAKGSEKKKLSLSDYKNKKTGATSTSPPEPSVAKKKESERAAAPNAPDSKSASEPKSSTEVKRSDRPKPREQDPPAEIKQRLPTREPVVDMRLPPKPPIKHPLPPRPPSPNIRKRVVDIDEETRPQKRPKPDASRSADDRSQAPRDDVRRKDRLPPSSSSRDATSHRDEKPPNSSTTSSSSLPNGRAMLKNAVNSGRNASPVSRPRGDSVNGARPALTGSNRATPTKLDAPKSSVPPLLSPLHLSFDDRDGSDVSPAKADKKKRDEPREQVRSPKAKRGETTSGTKRQKSPIRIPPLLSPTLPAVVEEALQLRKKSSLESLDGKPKGEKESPSKKKKPVVDYSDDDDDEPLQNTRRKTFIVTLKIPKKCRQMFRRIMALPSSTTARKELQTNNQERVAAEESSQPPPARKRPVAGAAEGTTDSTGIKRPRAADQRLPAPSTPSKKGTAAMSRVSSTNSLAQTPGDTVNATPSAATSSDRRVNGQEAHRPESVEARAMRQKETNFSNLGRRLKHEADVMMGGGRRSPGPNGHTREPNLNMGYVVHLESLLAFMAGFHAQNTYRGLCNKRSDPTGWASLFPLMEFLQREMRRQESQSRRFIPLYALLLLLHGTALGELTKCHAALDNPSFSIGDFLRAERSRNRIWSQLRDANASIENSNLRIEITPWTSLDEITMAAIRMLRRWCADADVDWVPDPSLKEPVVPRSIQNQNQTSRS